MNTNNKIKRGFNSLYASASNANKALIALGQAMAKAECPELKIETDRLKRQQCLFSFYSAELRKRIGL
ncbi:MAG: hypothetical protein JKY93_12565 [Gammaproteobacteria bacterium]|nr:hypothetical protein [Gammaproteobacteria bacterium]